MKLQLELEHKYAAHNINRVFTDFTEDFIATPMQHINEYMGKPVDSSRADLVEVMSVLQEHYEKLPEYVMSLLTHVFIKRSMSVQALAGMLFNRFDMEIYQRRLKVIEVILLAIEQSEFVTVERVGDYMMFTANNELTSNLRDEVDKYGFALPMLTPPHVASNNDIGYKTFKEHIILGGKNKEHDGELCLDHINRLNEIPYKYEGRLALLTEPVFNYEPKVKKNGQYEDKVDIQKRKEAFNHLHLNLHKKLKVFFGDANSPAYTNVFYLAHKYDNRIRTYVKAYEFNYQGTKFLKAMLQFAEPELTTGEW